jgi:hypothetical protein
MAGEYEELLGFVRDHASDPVTAAKAITAWSWAALLPGGGYGPQPTSPEDVPVGLAASCGWRHLLMKDLFAEIGIRARWVNFYDVPFQGNHTGTELLINGKWMFFDATFGTYFERAGGSQPLSIEEARNEWPNVVVRKSTLPGWQGTFLDPGSIEASGTFSKYVGSFFSQPETLHGRADRISGEMNSLYLGPDVVREGGIAVNSAQRSWLIRSDNLDSFAWHRYQDAYDASGRLDVRYGLYDDNSTWFVDWDQGDRFSWSTKTTYVTARSFFDYSVTVYEDGTRTINDNDQSQTFDWTTKTTSYSSQNAPDRQVGVYDDGRHWSLDWDQANRFNWKQLRETENADGDELSSYVLYDTGSTRRISWDAGGDYSWSRVETYQNAGTGFDFRITQNDDGTRIVAHTDPDDIANWHNKATYYKASGAADYQTGTFDDGSTWLIDLG